MAYQGFGTPELENKAGKNHKLSFKVTLYGSTTEASITANSDCGPGARVWLSSQSASAPSAANFSGLTSASSPTVIGMVIDCDGRASKLHGVTIPVNSIRSASMTAGVVTNKGATSAISGNTGVTSDGDLAFQISCTNLDLDAAALNHEFTVEVNFDVL